MKYLITSSSYRAADFLDWQAEFSEVYRHLNVKRSEQTMWLKVVEDASQVGEAIRKRNLLRALDRLTHTCCWVVSFVDKILVEAKNGNKKIFLFKPITSIDDMLWYKYPAVCYRCLEPICTCGDLHTEDRITM